MLAGQDAQKMCPSRHLSAIGISEILSPDRAL
jgi:hypothetical protein